jgi:uncharacterized membrane protein (UPF0127 family)
MSTIRTRKRRQNRTLSYTAAQHAKPWLTTPGLHARYSRFAKTSVFQTMSYTGRNKISPLKVGCTVTTNLKLAIATLLALLLLTALQPAAHADPLLTYPLQIGEQHARVEIANTADTRRKGLMYRTRLPASSGMIFIFASERPISMWMKNTRIPLSVAFIDAAGRIINIEQMQPETEQTHSSNGPAKYALEMNQGWFEKHGIASGARVTGLERLPAAE